MEVKKQFDGLLTNVEVYKLIAMSREERDSKSAPMVNREFVETQTVNYLRYVSSVASVEAVKKFITRVKELQLGLTEAEMVQLANHLPRYVVEIHLVCED